MIQDLEGKLSDTPLQITKGKGVVVKVMVKKMNEKENKFFVEPKAIGGKEVIIVEPKVKKNLKKMVTPPTSKP